MNAIVMPTRRWALNYYINSVKTGSQTAGVADELETRCGRASQHSDRELRAPGPPVEHQENEKDTTTMAHKSGGQYMLQLCSDLQLPSSHTTPFRTPCK